MFHACTQTLARSMPPGSSTDPPALRRSPGKGSGKQSWTSHTQHRIQGLGWKIVHRRGADRAQVPDAEVSARACVRATELVEEEHARQRAAGTERAETDDVVARAEVRRLRLSIDAVRQTAMEEYRYGQGVLATGFEPQRHSIFVKGRPVQVRLQ